jgi:DNA-binding NtrC family response regulator
MTRLSHALVSRFVLPGMNGSQLAEQLKARQPKARVLFMTGYSADALSHQWLSNTDTEMLHKPLTHETVERKVRQTLPARVPADLNVICGALVKTFR